MIQYIIAVVRTPTATAAMAVRIDHLLFIRCTNHRGNPAPRFICLVRNIRLIFFISKPISPGLRHSAIDLGIVSCRRGLKKEDMVHVYTDIIVNMLGVNVITGLVQYCVVV